MKMNFYYRCICYGLFLWAFAGHRASAQANFHLVKELIPGTLDDTYIPEMKVINGYLYFTDLDHGLLRTDGTKSGTIVIEEPGTFFYWDYTPTQGGFYYRAENWKDNRTQTIRKTTGQAGASVTITSSFVSISNLIEINGLLYFIGDDGVHGKEIWRTDGTLAGTFMTKDIGKVNETGGPRHLTACNGMLFFSMDDGVHGREIWRTDGTETGTILLKDIWPGSIGSSPWDLEVLNNEVYMHAQNPTNGGELWKTDGTELGTVLIKDIVPGPDWGGPFQMRRVGDAIFFEAWHPQTGRALWRTQGTEQTTYMVKDICQTDQYPNFEERFDYLTDVNGVLYFLGDDGIHGWELWKSDGTEAGTIMVKDLTAGNTDESKIENLFSFNGHLFFISNSQLWKSDGGPCNTVQMTFADGVSLYDFAPRFAGLGDKLFLPAGTEDTGGELFYYDYSTGGPKGVCSQDITIADVQKTFGDAPFTLDAVVNSGLPLVFTSNDANVVTINGNTVTITGGGAVTITATQAGDVNYAPATAQKTIVIEKKSQTITFDALPNKIFGEAPFSVTATSSSGLPVSFSSADNTIASIFNNKIMLHGGGDVVITATQEGDNRYLAAAPVTQTLSIKLVTAVEPISPNKVSVYPNPVADYLTLQGFSSEESVKVQLHRMDGKVVDTQDFSGRTDYQLDMNSLTPGIYLITITSAKGRTSERIIKK